MASFLVKRSLIAIPTIIGITLVVFAIAELTPGDPAKLMLGPIANEESIEKLHNEWGLDKPITTQYIRWIGRAIKGDLGESFQFRRPVADELFSKAGATVLLVVSAATIAAVGGTILGAVSGLKPNSLSDQTSRISSAVGISIPEFWCGIILIWFFAVKLKWLPSSGLRPRGQTELELIPTLKHLILPSITLAIPQMAIISRLARSNFIEVVKQDYIGTAKAKGLNSFTIFRRHILRNALIPIITVIGWQLGYLLGATVLVEVVFAWPGIGQLTVIAANSRDYATLQAITLVIAVAVVLINILVDALYGIIDPRVRVK